MRVGFRVLGPNLIPKSRGMAGEGSANMEDVIGSEEGEEEVEEMEVEEEGGGWDDWGSDGEDSDPEFKCLFCALTWRSAGDLFIHCSSVHSFDFHGVRKLFGLDFYSSFKLINFIRSQVRIFVYLVCCHAKY